MAQAAWRPRDGIEAEYVVESPVRCPGCAEEVDRLHVLRLLRTRVNFTSAMPRRGLVVTCPRCHTILSAHLGSVRL